LKARNAPDLLVIPFNCERKLNTSLQMIHWALLRLLIRTS